MYYFESSSHFLRHYTLQDATIVEYSLIHRASCGSLSLHNDHSRSPDVCCVMFSVFGLSTKQMTSALLAEISGVIVAKGPDAALGPCAGVGYETTMYAVICIDIPTQ